MRFVHLSLIICVCYFNNNEVVDGIHDETTLHPNTLFDDADDIQKQLDNEARDKLKYGHTQYFHLRKTKNNNRKTPQELNSSREISYINMVDIASSDAWQYKDQQMWFKKFPDCKNGLQSPVDLPSKALVPITIKRKLMFCNYNTLPENLELNKDGRRVIMYGLWKDKERPFIYGGPAYTRKYIFHSLALHLPSEHLVGGVHYPVESQALHVSADYANFAEAVLASKKDPLAFLSIGSLYQFSNKSQQGLCSIASIVKNMKGPISKESVPIEPLNYFVPSFKEYVIYHGSLTSPPCTQAVQWLIRGRTLSVHRSVVKEIFRWIKPKGGESEFSFRDPQPLNDRKIFYVH